MPLVILDCVLHQGGSIYSFVVFDRISLGGTAKRVETCLHVFSQALITILVLRRPRVNWIQNGPRVVQVSAAVAAEIAAEGFVVILRQRRRVAL